MPNLIKTTDTGLFKANKHSSVFLENSDILDDKDYSQVYQQQQHQQQHHQQQQQQQTHHHRHSTIAMPPDSVQFVDRARRFSDTKLLHAVSDLELDNATTTNPVRQPIFNVAHVLGVSMPSTRGTITSGGPAVLRHRTVDECFVVPQITEILFDSTDATYDPLELNIHEMLDADHTHNSTSSSLKRQRLSLHTVSAADADHGQRVADNRNFFKSLPNLSASSENLLQK